MDKRISIRATKFFQLVIKEYKAGHATRLTLGAHNKKITLNGGKDMDVEWFDVNGSLTMHTVTLNSKQIAQYKGKHVAELMHRINHYMERN